MIWEAYIQPWDTMSNVCAIECPVDVIDRVKRIKEKTCANKNAKRLTALLDPVARRVKHAIETDMLPAFVKSSNYVVFLQERFPMADKNMETTPVVVHRAGATKVVKQQKEGETNNSSSGEANSDSKNNHSRPKPRQGSTLTFATQLLANPAPPSPTNLLQASSQSSSRNLQKASTRNLVGVTARPALQAKLAIMADELNEIERDAALTIKFKRKAAAKPEARRHSFLEVGAAVVAMETPTSAPVDSDDIVQGDSRLPQIAQPPASSNAATSICTVS